MSTYLRQGWLIFLLFLSASARAAEPPPDPRLAKLASHRIELEYNVSAAALPLTRVELWYTRDQGETWFEGEADADAQSPLIFQAPSDGLYGFFVVLTNAAGSSSEPPKPGAAPQAWALIDATPPVVQLHSASLASGTTAAPLLSIRWTAVDTQFPARPVELSWHTWPEGRWQTISSALANTGRFDWLLPAGMSGAIQIRVVLRDRGDNTAYAESARIDLSDASLHQQGGETPGAKDLPAPVSDEAHQRARRLYQQGSLHQLRGEQKLAASRFRDALRLDPALTAALVELASSLYAQRAYDEAIEAYGLALKQDARSRASLEGMAKACVAKRDYTAAGRYLRQLVGDRPDDARAWLSLGDVAIYQGDEVLAREYYLKAATCDPRAADAANAARLRLADLSAISQPLASDANRSDRRP